MCQKYFKSRKILIVLFLIFILNISGCSKEATDTVAETTSVSDEEITERNTESASTNSVSAVNTETQSVSGEAASDTNLKHMEWGDSADYGFAQ